MRVLFTILLLLILTPSAFADLDSIVVNVYDLAADFDADDFLHWPRYQAQWQDGKDTLVLVGQGTSTAIQRSTNSGQTWGIVAGDIASFGPSPWSGGDHAHTFILGDTLYVSYRGPGDSAFFGRMDLNGAMTVISRDTVASSVACNYTDAVMSPVKIGNTIVAGIRGGDCNFRYITTTDFFATKANEGYIEDYSAILGAANTRGGMLIGNSGEALWTGWLDYASVDSLVLYTYSIGTDTWTKIAGGLGHATLERFYSAMPFQDSLIMVVSTDIGTNDTLLYGLYNENSETWSYGTVFERTDNGGTYETMPALAREDSTGVLGLFYTYTQNLHFRYMKDDLTWSTEFTLIGADTSLRTDFAMTIPYATPSVSGPVFGCVVMDASNAYWVSVRAYESAGGAPPSTPEVYIRKGYIKSGPLGGN